MNAVAATSLALSLLLAGSPAAAQEEGLTHDQAERRARACLTAGSAGAPRSSLADAVVALRTLCTPQINRLRDIRVSEATAGLAPADAEAAERRILRELNDEIVLAVANFTGLSH